MGGDPAGSTEPTALDPTPVALTAPQGPPLDWYRDRDAMLAARVDAEAQRELRRAEALVRARQESARLPGQSGSGGWKAEPDPAPEEEILVGKILSPLALDVANAPLASAAAAPPLPSPPPQQGLQAVVARLRPPPMDCSPVMSLGDNPRLRVSGEHKVIVHLLVGSVRRGMVRDLDLNASKLSLVAPHGLIEVIARDHIKAIFFLRTGKSSDASANGRMLRIALIDGRTLVGFSTDDDLQSPGFFLVPADSGGTAERIFVFRAAVRALSANRPASEVPLGPATAVGTVGL